MIDLHVHSTISDGTYTPAELAHLAKDRGIEAFAVTDHDNISGSEEAQLEAKKLGIGCTYGMEMSVEHLGRTMHIICLGFDPQHPSFIKLYRKLRLLKESGVEDVVAFIRRQGVDLSFEKVKNRAGDCRPDSYTVMKELFPLIQGKTAGELWRGYINPALENVGLKYDWQAEELLPLMKEAGGITSLAHFHKSTGLLTFEPHEREEIIRTLLGFGLAGMERYYPSYTAEDSAFAAAMIEKYNMIPTGGTDYHGANRKAVELGTGTNNNMNVPYSFWTALQERLNNK